MKNLTCVHIVVLEIQNTILELKLLELELDPAKIPKDTCDDKAAS